MKIRIFLMTSTKLFFYGYLILIPLFFVPSCDLDIPANELAEAKKQLGRAREVKSEKYAITEYQQAMDALLKAHKLIEKEKVKDAKIEAEKSKQSSTTAIDISLPLLAQDTLKTAKQNYEELDRLYASEYAPDEFKNTDSLIKDSELRLNSSALWDSYLKSEEAIKVAELAKSKALAKIPELKENAAQLNDKSSLLKKYTDAQLTSSEINQLNSFILSATENINNNNLKLATENLRQAEDLLKKVNEKVLRLTAEKKLKNAYDDLVKAKASPQATRFTGDITKIASIIDSARSLFNKNAYIDSIPMSDEAIQLLGRLFEEMKINQETNNIRTDQKKN